MLNDHRMGGRCVETGAHGDTGGEGTMTIQLTCCQGNSVLANSPSLEVITEVIATSQLVLLLYQNTACSNCAIIIYTVHTNQQKLPVGTYQTYLAKQSVRPEQFS